MGTVTSLRRVWVCAGAGLCLLVCLALISVLTKMIVLSAGGLLAAAVMSVLCAAIGGADAAGRLRAATRLRKQGRITDATIVSLDERYVSIPSGFSGWVTTVKVTFTDASGHLTNAGYTDHAPAGGRRRVRRSGSPMTPAGRFRSPPWVVAVTRGSMMRFTSPWLQPAWWG